MDIFRRLKLYREYKRSLKNIRVDLESKFGIRVDRANRMYTVVNIPQNLIEEPYNIRKSDIDILSKTYMTDYTKALGEFLDENGLREMYVFYEPIRNVGKASYLLVVGFRHLNTVDFNRLIWFRLLPIFLYMAMTFVSYMSFGWIGIGVMFIVGVVIAYFAMRGSFQSQQ